MAGKVLSTIRFLSRKARKYHQRGYQERATLLECGNKLGRGWPVHDRVRQAVHSGLEHDVCVIVIHGMGNSKETVRVCGLDDGTLDG